MHNIIDRIVRCTINGLSDRGSSPADADDKVRKGFAVIKAEDFQQYGKEHFDNAVASAASLQNGAQAIAAAMGDYTKKSFEDGNAFVTRLSGVQSIDKAIEVQTDYAKSAYESFVAETHKISELYVDLAKQACKPFEGLIAKMTPAR